MDAVSILVPHMGFFIDGICGMLNQLIVSRRIRKNRRDFRNIGTAIGFENGGFAGAIIGRLVGEIAHEGLKKMGSYDRKCRNCGGVASPIDEFGSKTLYRCSGCGSSFTGRS